MNVKKASETKAFHQAQDIDRSNPPETLLEAYDLNAPHYDRLIKSTNYGGPLYGRTD